jgi:hypothetical protein
MLIYAQIAANITPEIPTTPTTVMFPYPPRPKEKGRNKKNPKSDRNGHRTYNQAFFCLASTGATVLLITLNAPNL